MDTSEVTQPNGTGVMEGTSADMHNVAANSQDACVLAQPDWCYVADCGESTVIIQLGNDAKAPPNVNMVEPENVDLRIGDMDSSNKKCDTDQDMDGEQHVITMNEDKVAMATTDTDSAIFTSSQIDCEHDVGLKENIAFDITTKEDTSLHTDMAIDLAKRDDISQDSKRDCDRNNIFSIFTSIECESKDDASYTKRQQDRLGETNLSNSNHMNVVDDKEEREESTTKGVQENHVKGYLDQKFDTSTVKMGLKVLKVKLVDIMSIQMNNIQEQDRNTQKEAKDKKDVNDDKDGTYKNKDGNDNKKDVIDHEVENYVNDGIKYLVDHEDEMDMNDYEGENENAEVKDNIGGKDVKDDKDENDQKDIPAITHEIKKRGRKCKGKQVKKRGRKCKGKKDVTNHEDEKNMNKNKDIAKDGKNRKNVKDDTDKKEKMGVRDHEHEKDVNDDKDKKGEMEIKDNIEKDVKDYNENEKSDLKDNIEEKDMTNDKDKKENMDVMDDTEDKDVKDDKDAMDYDDERDVKDDKDDKEKRDVKDDVEEKVVKDDKGETEKRDIKKHQDERYVKDKYEKVKMDLIEHEDTRDVNNDKDEKEKRDVKDNVKEKVLTDDKDEERDVKDHEKEKDEEKGKDKSENMIEKDNIQEKLVKDDRDENHESDVKDNIKEMNVKDDINVNYKTDEMDDKDLEDQKDMHLRTPQIKKRGRKCKGKTKISQVQCEVCKIWYSGTLNLQKHVLRMHIDKTFSEANDIEKGHVEEKEASGIIHEEVSNKQNTDKALSEENDDANEEQPSKPLVETDIPLLKEEDASTDAQQLKLEEKPFLCWFCNASFTHNDIRMRHVKKEHCSVRKDNNGCNNLPESSEKGSPKCCKTDTIDRTDANDHTDIRKLNPNQRQKSKVANLPNKLKQGVCKMILKKSCKKYVKPYQCKVCGQCFGNYTKYTAHIAQAHIDDGGANKKTYPCPFCGLHLSNSEGCRRHKKRRHPKEHEASKKRKGKGVLQKYNKLERIDKLKAICLAEVKVVLTDINADKKASERNSEFQTVIKETDQMESLCSHGHVKQGENAATPNDPKPEITSESEISETKKFSNIVKDCKTGKGPHLCHICGNCYPKAAKLRHHMTVHTGESMYKCDICGKCFMESRNLRRHIGASHYGHRPYQCKVCGVYVTQQGTLTRHLRSHKKKGEMPITCNVCGKAFNSESFLKVHMLVHQVDKEKETDKDKSQLDAQELERQNSPETTYTKTEEVRRLEEKQKRTMSKSKDILVQEDSNSYKVRVPKGRTRQTAYRCKICGKHFPDPEKLQLHFASHTDKNAYQCSICKMIFGLRVNYVKHMREHKQYRIYNCKFCHQAFHNKEKRSNHERHHLRAKVKRLKKANGNAPAVNSPIPNRKKSRTCSVCGKFFRKRISMRIHMVRCKKTRIQNPEAKGTVDQAVTSGSDSKQFRCEVKDCNAVFTHHTQLLNHMASHERSILYECGMCKEHFAKFGLLKVHMSKHSSEDSEISYEVDAVSNLISDGGGKKTSNNELSNDNKPKSTNQSNNSRVLACNSKCQTTVASIANESIQRTQLSDGIASNISCSNLAPIQNCASSDDITVTKEKSPRFHIKTEKMDIPPATPEPDICAKFNSNHDSSTGGEDVLNVNMEEVASMQSPMFVPVQAPHQTMFPSPMLRTILDMPSESSPLVPQLTKHVAADQAPHDAVESRNRDHCGITPHQTMFPCPMLRTILDSPSESSPLPQLTQHVTADQAQHDTLESPREGDHRVITPKLETGANQHPINIANVFSLQSTTPPVQTQVEHTANFEYEKDNSHQQVNTSQVRSIVTDLSKEKRYKCDYCEVRFKWGYTRRRHVKRKHSQFLSEATKGAENSSKHSEVVNNNQTTSQPQVGNGTNESSPVSATQTESLYGQNIVESALADTMSSSVRPQLSTTMNQQTSLQSSTIPAMAGAGTPIGQVNESLISPRQPDLNQVGITRTDQPRTKHLKCDYCDVRFSWDYTKSRHMRRKHSAYLPGRSQISASISFSQSQEARVINDHINDSTLPFDDGIREGFPHRDSQIKSLHDDSDADILTPDTISSMASQISTTVNQETYTKQMQTVLERLIPNTTPSPTAAQFNTESQEPDVMQMQTVSESHDEALPVIANIQGNLPIQSEITSAIKRPRSRKQTITVRQDFEKVFTDDSKQTCKKVKDLLEASFPISAVNWRSAEWQPFVLLKYSGTIGVSDDGRNKQVAKMNMLEIGSELYHQESHGSQLGEQPSTSSVQMMADESEHNVEPGSCIVTEVIDVDEETDTASEELPVDDEDDHDSPMLNIQDTAEKTTNTSKVIGNNNPTFAHTSLRDVVESTVTRAFSDVESTYSSSCARSNASTPTVPTEHQHIELSPQLQSTPIQACTKQQRPSTCQQPQPPDKAQARQSTSTSRIQEARLKRLTNFQQEIAKINDAITKLKDAVAEDLACEEEALTMSSSSLSQQMDSVASAANAVISTATRSEYLQVSSVSSTNDSLKPPQNHQNMAPSKSSLNTNEEVVVLDESSNSSVNSLLFVSESQTNTVTEDPGTKQDPFQEELAKINNDIAKIQSTVQTVVNPISIDPRQAHVPPVSPVDSLESQHMQSPPIRLSAYDNLVPKFNMDPTKQAPIVICPESCEPVMNSSQHGPSNYNISHGYMDSYATSSNTNSSSLGIAIHERSPPPYPGPPISPASTSKGSPVKKRKRPPPPTITELKKDFEFVCKICPKGFNSDKSIKRHMLLHRGVKYPCDICGRTFTQPTDVRRHKRIHTGERPYKCDLCEKAFTTSWTMKMHRMTHTGEKPYKCALCGRGFKQRNLMKQHEKLHGTGGRVDLYNV